MLDVKETVDVPRGTFPWLWINTWSGNDNVVLNQMVDSFAFTEICREVGENKGLITLRVKQRPVTPKFLQQLWNTLLAEKDVLLLLAIFDSADDDAQPVSAYSAMRFGKKMSVSRDVQWGADRRLIHEVYLEPDLFAARDFVEDLPCLRSSIVPMSESHG